MPANIVKPGQEGKWDKAKAAARKQYPDLSEDNPRFWKIVTTIFKNMTREESEKSFGICRLGGSLVPVCWKSRVGHGKLSERIREEISYAGSPKREEMPESVFLLPGERKYPVKEKRNGKWEYSEKLLLAAARRARMQGNEELATRADRIRAGLNNSEKSLGIWLRVA